MTEPPKAPSIFDQFSDDEREALLHLRALVFDVAEKTAGVGEVFEDVKWGEPSFLTRKPKSGSTIRISSIKGKPGKVGVFFICHTGLVDTFRDHYSDVLEFDGNRAIVLDAKAVIPENEIRHCLALALSYHSRKR